MFSKTAVDKESSRQKRQQHVLIAPRLRTLVSYIERFLVQDRAETLVGIVYLDVFVSLLTGAGHPN